MLTFLQILICLHKDGDDVRNSGEVISASVQFNVKGILWAWLFEGDTVDWLVLSQLVGTSVVPLIFAMVNLYYLLVLMIRVRESPSNGDSHLEWIWHAERVFCQKFLLMSLVYSAGSHMIGRSST